MVDGRTTAEILGENIAKRRDLMGKSQRAMAEECGLDQATIYRIENGKRLPTKEQAVVIANFFHGELNELHLAFPYKYPAPDVASPSTSEGEAA